MIKYKIKKSTSSAVWQERKAHNSVPPVLHLIMLHHFRFPKLLSKEVTSKIFLQNVPKKNLLEKWRNHKLYKCCGNNLNDIDFFTI